MCWSKAKGNLFVPKHTIDIKCIIQENTQSLASGDIKCIQENTQSLVSGDIKYIQENTQSLASGDIKCIQENTQSLGLFTSGITSVLDVFLHQHLRQRCSMTDDGNCLFRSFSFIIFGTQSNHFQIRIMLVDLMAQNASYFNSHCHPLSVEEHTKQMRNNYIWGRHAEIRALSLYSQMPVFIAMEKEPGQYYWAQYKCIKKADTELALPSAQLHYQEI